MPPDEDEKPSNRRLSGRGLRRVRAADAGSLGDEALIHGAGAGTARVAARSAGAPRAAGFLRFFPAHGKA